MQDSENGRVVTIDLSFQSFDSLAWAYLMQFIPETCRAHYIRYIYIYIYKQLWLFLIGSIYSYCQGYEFNPLTHVINTINCHLLYACGLGHTTRKEVSIWEEVDDKSCNGHVEVHPLLLRYPIIRCVTTLYVVSDFVLFSLRKRLIL